MSQDTEFVVVARALDISFGDANDVLCAVSTRSAATPQKRATMSSAKEGVRQGPFPAATTGRSFPIGGTLVAGGANFSVFSRSAASIELLFFDRVDDARPSRVIPIDPAANRTYRGQPS
ncbi:MAG: hypothetical protein WCC92_20705 [Candidatus Korobacteraceae bacterium]